MSWPGMSEEPGLRRNSKKHARNIEEHGGDEERGRGDMAGFCACIGASARFVCFTQKTVVSPTLFGAC